MVKPIKVKKHKRNIDISLNPKDWVMVKWKDRRGEKHFSNIPKPLLTDLTATIINQGGKVIWWKPLVKG